MISRADARNSGDTGTPCGHELVEHTADIGIRCWGSTPDELFREAARGLIEVMVGPAGDSGEVRLNLELQAPCVEELLVTWLNELLFRFEIEGFLPGEIAFEQLEEQRLRARLSGARIDPARWPIERQVKAATYHLLQVEHSIDTWRATIYLDL